LNKSSGDPNIGRIDWSRSPDAQSVPGRCSGAWVAKDSRVMVQAILDNVDDASAAEIADMFELPVAVVRRILAFAENEARLERATQAGLEAVRGIFITARSNLMRQLRALPRDRTAARKRAKFIRQLADINRLCPGASSPPDDDAHEPEFSENGRFISRANRPRS
jgi:uncharacterized protein (DUF433 family)